MAAQLLAHPCLDLLPGGAVRDRAGVHDELAANVRRHDQHRVAEIHGAALAVGQPSLIKNLQQHIEDIRVRLLDLVEEHHAVGPAPHRLGELTALLVADVARGGAEHP